MPPVRHALSAEVAPYLSATAQVSAGGGDSGARVTSAIAAVIAAGGGGEVWLMPGDHTWSTVPKIPRASTYTGRLRFVWMPGAKVVLSASAPRCLDFDRTAEHQLFERIDLERPYVDANNVGGQHHVLIGSYASGGAVNNQRMNFNDIKVKDALLTNVPTNTNTAVDFRIGMWLSVLHLASGEGTQNYATNIEVDGFRMYGGHGAVWINAPGSSFASGANCYFDNIRVTRWWHDMLVPPGPTQVSTTHVLISNAGFGGTCYVADGWGRYSGDDGIEINAMQDTVIERCDIQDSFVAAYYFVNYHAASDVDRQRITLRECKQIVTSAFGTTGSPTTLGGVGFQVAFPKSNPVGQIVLDNCASLIDSQVTSKYSNLVGKAISIPVNYIRSLYLKGTFKLRVTGLNYDNATGRGGSYIDVSGGSSSGVVVPVKADNLDIVVAGANTGGGVFSLSVVNLANGDRIDDIRGGEIDINVTGQTAGSTIGLLVGSGTTRGGIRAFHCRRFAGDTNPTSIKFASVAGGLVLDKKYVVRDCDLSKQTSGTEVGFTSNDGAIMANVERRNVRRAVSPLAATGVTVTTSGNTSGVTPANTTTVFYYRNISGAPEKLLILGGTLSAVDFSEDGGSSIRTGHTLTNVENVLEPGDTVKITYTAGSAPTLRTRPGV